MLWIILFFLFQIKLRPLQITKQFAKSKFTRIFDIFNFHYINGLLSNLSTQAVNLTGTGTMTLLRTSEKYLAAGFNKLPGVGANVQAGEIGVTFTEAQLHTFGVTQALLEGAMFAESKSLLSRSAFGQAAKTAENLELGYKHELATPRTTNNKWRKDLKYREIKTCCSRTYESRSNK